MRHVCTPVDGSAALTTQLPIWSSWVTATKLPKGIYYSSLAVTSRIQLSSRGIPKTALPPSLQLFRSFHMSHTPQLRMH